MRKRVREREAEVKKGREAAMESWPWWYRGWKWFIRVWFGIEYHQTWEEGMGLVQYKIVG